MLSIFSDSITPALEKGVQSVNDTINERLNKIEENVNIKANQLIMIVSAITLAGLYFSSKRK